MELTGKCKEDFEKWFIETDKGNPIKSWISEDLGLIYLQTMFSVLPQSMQYGVYVDFFDSVGIIIDMRYIKMFKQFERVVSCVNRKIDSILYNDLHNTRQEAQIAAIKKANKIYNSM